jgi:hypothetical protein
VLVRDDKGNFIPDLGKDALEVCEDGLLQDISSMTVVTGGRVTNALLPPPAPPPEGIILPATRAQRRLVNLRVLRRRSHLQFHNTGRSASCSTRFRKSSCTKRHVGMVPSGPS